MKPPAAVCQFCGCTELAPCTTPTGEPCCWWSFERNVCSMPGCIREFLRRRDARRAEEKKKNRKKTPAEIHELIRRKGRGGKK